ncbi:hypothetical protein [Limnohabitans sp. Bal53]|jgi:hypothetical protein|uniref:hypothetical protein n=1 Tax=Limnohabitans sp. Bal53 TaxID=1977910 RepID=UPI000D39F8CA|nr:hypothetical protein [Limnohabitans sp. Bal53]MDP4734741.1 hypothetical protein [Limnohabitans sp.]PUE42569.1 hypothetical protein B9Z50_01525 [Limnohabitans sp. Bal53]
MNWIARIFMGLLGLVFLAAILFFLLFFIVFATLRWLLTGRKPQVVMVWQQFSAMRQGFKQGGFRSGFGQGFEPFRRKSAAFAQDDQVVDVEVREVVEDAPRLPPRKPHEPG